MRYDMRILGSVELLDGREEIALGPPKRRAMFAALALEHDHPVPLNQLVEALWVDSPPTSAVANIRTHAARLRRGLGDRLVARPRAYLLKVLPGELDVDRFDDLAEHGRCALGQGDPATAAGLLGDALSCWRGPAGDGLVGGTALERRFVAMDEQRLGVVEDRVEALLRLGRHAEAVTDLRRHLARHALRERAWGQLMLALYRSGNAAAALTAYLDARAALRNQLGVEPGPALNGLQRAILDRDPALSDPIDGRDRSVSTGSPPALAVPHELPPYPAIFVGRGDALAELSHALRVAMRGGGPAVVAVSGVAGSGKSALVTRGAHLAAADFPDGQVYLDLRASRSPAAVPTSAGEVLGRVLRTLGGRCAAGAGTGELAAEYRSVLAGRRMLILVDNAMDATQVRPLVPADPGTVLLVTSRRRLTTMDGVIAVELEPMPAADGMDMLSALAAAHRVAAEPGAARKLVDRCAGLPLVVRIVGARLARRPGWPLAFLVARLAHAPALLDELTCDDLSLRACFEADYRYLAAVDEPAALALRLLGALPAVEHAPYQLALGLGLSPELAGPVLERLVDARLLSCPRPGRYGLPELLHAYAAEFSAEPFHEDVEPVNSRHGARGHGAQTSCTPSSPHDRSPVVISWR
jgi:DNA-binding SARP family transcriptional activator